MIFLRKQITSSLVFACFLAVVIFICTAFFSDFKNFLNMNLKETTQETLSLRTQQSLYQLDHEIKNKFSVLETLSKTIEIQNTNLYAPEQSLPLKQIAKKEKCTQLKIIVPEQLNDSSFPYISVLQTAFSGKNAVSDVFFTSASSVGEIVFAVPIYKHNQISAVLTASYPASIFDPYLRSAGSDDHSQSLLISSNGQIIAASSNFSSIMNFQDYLHGANFFDQTSFDIMNEKIRNQQSGSIHYSLGDEEYYLRYAPFGLNQWYVIHIFPANMIEKQHTEISNHALSFCIKILFFLFAVLCIAFSYIHKKSLQARQSKKDLKILTDTVNGSVITMIYDEHLTLEYANAAYYDMFGIASTDDENVSHLQLIKFIYAPDRKQLFQKADKQISLGTTLELEFRSRTRDNKIYWLLLKGHQTKNIVENHQVYPVFNCVIVDITATKQTSRELETLTNSIPGGVAKIFIGSNISLLFANDGYYNLIGYSREEYEALGKRPLSKIIHPKDLDRTMSYLRAYAYQRQDISIEYRIIHKNGTVSWVLMRGNRLEENMITPVFQCVFMDITLNKELQKSLELESKRYRILADFSDDVLFEFDLTKQTMVFSKKYEALTGLNPAMTNFRETVVRYRLIYEEDVQLFLNFYDSFKSGEQTSSEIELRLNTRTSYVWCKIQAVTLFDESHQPISVIGKIVNIDLQKQETAKLRALAQKDTLTQLYNHNTTISLIQNLLKNSVTTDFHAMIVIDIDDFKIVNDTLGHLIGDKVLKLLSSQLSTLFRSSDVIGRIGGDEFVVFLKNIPSRELLLEKAEAICTIFREMCLEEHKSYKVSGSIGISLYPQDGTDYDVLFTKADSMLYFSKRRGKDCYTFYSDQFSHSLTP